MLTQINSDIWFCLWKRPWFTEERCHPRFQAKMVLQQLTASWNSEGHRCACCETDSCSTNSDHRKDRGDSNGAGRMPGEEERWSSLPAACDHARQVVEKVVEVPQVGSTTQGTVREEHVQGETKREENPPQVVQQAQHRSFIIAPNVTLGF